MLIAKEEGKVKSGDINLHYYADGPEDGEPVLMLHGFPQCSYMWRHQIGPLAEAGYRVVVPDLRGYYLSDRPQGVAPYRMEYLLQDVQAFYDHFGWQSANIVMHDWGGIIGWRFILQYPAKVRRVVAIDIPHMTAFRKELLTIHQARRSWYVAYFILPLISTWLAERNRQRFAGIIFGTAVQRQAFTKEDRKFYGDMLSQPGQPTAAMNYYKANFRPSFFRKKSGLPKPATDKVRMPVQLIYGDHDAALSPQVFERTRDYCLGYYKADELKDTGHWAAEEQPETVTRLILEHLKVSAEG